MTDFDEKQMKILSGSFSRIADAVGCTPKYVSLIIHGRRPAKANTAKAVVAKAKEVLEVLQPCDL